MLAMKTQTVKPPRFCCRCHKFDDAAAEQFAAAIEGNTSLNMIEILGPTSVSKNGLFEPFIYKNDHFTKTGSGQT
jgi:hypothetical protein